MHKTILVTGEVTRNQCQPVRLELMRKGHQPKIVRVTTQDLFLDDVELVTKYYREDRTLTPSEDETAYLDSNHEDHMRFAHRHITSFGDVIAVLVDQKICDAWNIGDYPDLVKIALSEMGIVRWLATPDDSAMPA